MLWLFLHILLKNLHQIKGISWKLNSYYALCMNKNDFGADQSQAQIWRDTGVDKAPELGMPAFPLFWLYLVLPGMSWFEGL